MKTTIKITILAMIIVLALLSMGSLLAYTIGPKINKLISHIQSQKNLQNIEASQKIKAMISHDHKLSVAARNITILIRGEAVYLEGHVASKDEQRKVEFISRQLSDGKRLYNKLTY